MIRTTLVILALLASSTSTNAAELPFKPVPAYSPEAQALREAITLQKEGDRLQEAERPGDARVSWLAALEAYERAGFKPGQVEVLFRIGGTYQVEASFDPQKQSLWIGSMMKGFIAASEHLREGMPREKPGDPDAVQQGDALFTEASKLATAGDCEKAVPLFSKAGEIYAGAGWGIGEASSLAERLRCLAKTPNLLGMVFAMGEVTTLIQKLKPWLQPGPSKLHLTAIAREEAGDRKEAETLYRRVISAAGEDPDAAGRAALDLGGLLAREGSLAEARELFRSARERFAALPGGRDLRNEIAAIQNLGSLDLATGRIDEAISGLRGAVDAWKTLGDPVRVSDALNALAAAFRQKGDVVSAEAASREARSLQETPAPQSGVEEARAGNPSEERALREPLTVEAGAGAIVVLDIRAQAQREAAFAMGEGDRLLQEGRLGDARRKWLAAAQGFRQIGNSRGAAEAYRRLGASYAPEAMADKRKMLLAVDYFNSALEAVAEIEEAERPSQGEIAEKGRTLLREASRLVAAGDCDKALPMIEEARRLIRQIGLPAGEIRAAVLKGRCEARRGDVGQAFLTLVEVMPALDSKPSATSTGELVLKAEAFLLQGKQGDARALYQEALCRYEAARDFEGIADTLLALGAVQLTLDDFQEAESSLARGLGLLPILANREDYRFQEAAAHHNLGSVFTATSRGREATVELRSALSLWRELGEPAREVASLAALGSALKVQGDFPGAFAVLDEAERLQSQLSPAPELEGDLLANRGAVHYSQGRFRESFASYERALDVYRRQPLPIKEAQTLTNLGLVEEALGNFPKSLALHREARAAARRAGAANLEVKAGINEANALVESGDYQAAIEAYSRLLSEVQTSGELWAEAAVRVGLGAAYLRIGDFASANARFEEALAELQRLGSIEGKAGVLLNRGYLLSLAGKPERAEQDLREALRIWTALGNETVAARVQVNLDLESLKQEGDPEEQLEHLEQMLKASQEAGLARDALRLSLLIGDFQLRQKDFPAALEKAAEVVAEAQRNGDSTVEFAAHGLALESRIRQGDLAGAVHELERCLTLVDLWQRGLTVSELKTHLLDQLFGVYLVGALLESEMGHAESAFRFAEQSRARAFLDQIGNQRIEVRRGAEPELIRQESELRARLSHLGSSMEKERNQASPKQGVLDNLGKILKDAQEDYGSLLVRLKLANPEYAALVSVETLSLSEVQQMLDERTTLVEYFVPSFPQGGEEGFKALAWVVDRAGSVMVQLPISVGDLKNRVTELRNLIEARPLVDRRLINQYSADLYRDLFAPLAPYIRNQSLVIVAHGVLHFLPFAMLWDGKRYVGDTYALSYSPSATTLKFAREKKARAVGPLLAAGAPDASLQFAAKETRAVARLYGVDALLGSAASEGAVVAWAEQAGILHLAAHAKLNPDNPLFTRIELAPDAEHDGHLDMHEVFGLDLSKTGLVVLSACSTQMGRLTGGDEIEGLTRAFLYAGTPAVMASLWNVDDESTALFMERFYSHLRKGKGRAEALRRAQMETRRKFPHPYHWAAFVLTGDGR
jgi:CHAT domain-containing protein/Tfp pilus assembly protein PilF